MENTIYNVSVIIPVYNVETYIGECLDSVLDNQGMEMEIICVDDVSCDGSAEIVKKYAKKHPQIRLITHETNRGLSAARNTGWKVATGKYIYFLDSDDYLKPNALTNLCKILEENEADVAYFDTEVICESEELWEKIKNYRAVHKRKYEGIYMGKHLFRLMKQREDLDTAAWRQIWRREALNKTGIWFYEGIYHEDNLFSIQTMMKAKRAMCINEQYHCYRYRAGSITSEKVNEKHFWSMCKVFMELQRYGMEHEFGEKVEKEYVRYLKFIAKRVKRYYEALGEDFDIDTQSAGHMEKHFAKLLVGKLLD